MVFAALAVPSLIEQGTDWSIKRFVRTGRRYRTIDIHATPRTGHLTTRTHQIDRSRVMRTPQLSEVIHGRELVEPVVADEVAATGHPVEPFGTAATVEHDGLNPRAVRRHHHAPILR
jgi:hypothetical protein